MSCPTGPIYTHCQIHCSIGLSLSLSVCVTLLFCQVALTGRVIAAPQEMVCGEQRNCQCECSLAEQRVLLVQIGLSLSLTTHWSSVCHSHTHTHTPGLPLASEWGGGWMAGDSGTDGRHDETECPVHQERQSTKRNTKVKTVLFLLPFSYMSCSSHTHTHKSFISSNPDVAMESVVQMAQQLSVAQRTQVVHLLSSMSDHRMSTSITDTWSWPAHSTSECSWLDCLASFNNTLLFDLLPCLTCVLFPGLFASLSRCCVLLHYMYVCVKLRTCL